tara:strand:+ start:230 stop:685 length:456 start_codon:yes stop_codon:yes gene_type:complete
MNFMSLLTNPVALGATALGVGAATQIPNLYAAAQGRAREGGSALGGDPVGRISEKDVKDYIRLQEAAGGMAAKQYAQLSPLVNRNLDLAQARAMQLAQQQGQITGGLAQQKYQYQLAGGAQQLGGQVLGSMLQNANPYGAEAFKAGVNIQL